MRIALCDDESLFTENLKKYIERYYHSLDVLIDIFQSGDALLKQLEKNITSYDVIFLDIEMPGKNGLEVAKIIRTFDEKTMIIFLTSHKEFTLEGYEVSAFRYLLKPIDEEKLNKALKNIMTKQQKDKKLLLREEGEDHFIRMHDIFYIEADDKYVKIYTAYGMVSIRKAISEMEKILDQAMFFRCHRSYIVNMSYVKGCDGKLIHMKKGHSIILSRMRRKAFKDSMITFIKNDSY